MKLDDHFSLEEIREINMDKEEFLSHVTSAPDYTELILRITEEMDFIFRYCSAEAYVLIEEFFNNLTAVHIKDLEDLDMSTDDFFDERIAYKAFLDNAHYLLLFFAQVHFEYSDVKLNPLEFLRHVNPNATEVEKAEIVFNMKKVSRDMNLEDPNLDTIEVY